jgi:hypothetical protein
MFRKEQLDDFLQHIEQGKPWWETGGHFKIMKKKK